MAKKIKKVSDKTKIRKLHRTLAAAVEKAANFEMDLMAAKKKIEALANQEIEPQPGIEAATVPLVARIGFLEQRIKSAIGLTHEDRTKHLLETLNPPVEGEAKSE